MRTPRTLSDSELLLCVAGVGHCCHRNRRLTDDAFGDTAHEPAADAFPTVGAHHHEIDGFVVDVLDDLLVGRPFPEFGDEFDIEFGGEGLDLSERFRPGVLANLLQ
ncbi:hypothetical protein SAMN06269185_1017 [Natronoarchaeum philippinense]|uniref:Uncharacterized protein n=1 Tax=Natronoarchaeum philippinense TaxID=558529 RepID=A0A285N9R9_NATPI|nr:hypothetical protein SAMN06269185_1017 [Natronoarchaeum philippinense]